MTWRWSEFFAGMGACAVLGLFLLSYVHMALHH